MTTTAARVAGFTYLYLLVTAGFAEFAVRGGIVVPGDAALTARNIADSEGMYRLGIAADLIAAPANVVLAVALYALLRPVGRDLALAAALWRTGEAILLGGATIPGFAAVEAATGGDAAQAALFVEVHASAYRVGLIYFGLGSTVFYYLLLRSGFVPRAVAWWGMGSAVLIPAGVYAVIVSPGLADLAPMTYLPIGLFEAAFGVWLLARPPHLRDQGCEQSESPTPSCASAA